MALDQWADHRGGQLVDERPRLGFAHQSLEQSRVRRLEAIAAELQELHRHLAPLVDGARPERLYQDEEVVLSRVGAASPTPRATARTAGR